MTIFAKVASCNLTRPQVTLREILYVIVCLIVLKISKLFTVNIKKVDQNQTMFVETCRLQTPCQRMLRPCANIVPSRTHNTTIVVQRRCLKCRSNRSRQELEAEYYKEWERLTLVPEEELNRKMTFVSFVRFVPMWLRYHGLPGPLRYLLFATKKPGSSSSSSSSSSGGGGGRSTGEQASTDAET